MSDNENASLDDFFARKDKGKKIKKKTKKTLISPSDLTTEAPTVEVKVKKDEWRDFEEEKEKDYSSLKIQDLQVSEEADKEEENEEKHEDIDDENIDSEKPKKSESKWITENCQTAPAPVVVAVPEKQIGQENVVAGKYVPPSMKRSMNAAPLSRRRVGAPPDISSQAAFPTLGAASRDTEKLTADFELVKRGLRTNDSRVTDSSRPTLDLGNRYDGLRN